MKTVYLAEKPAQAADIAKILGAKGRREGYIELVNGDAITWAVGHLLELLEPKEYTDAWNRWSWDVLPMVPEEFKYRVVDKKKDQVKAIKALLKTADRVVIATDAGREGELIARELLSFCKYKGRVDRLWVHSLVAADIAAGLKALLPGKEKEPLFEAALARQHCDWVYGYTMSRATTLGANVPRETFPVGRVQTAVLGLVVRRHEAIRNFKPEEYYELEANVTSASGKTFKMWHAPSEEKRIRTKAEAERLLKLAEKASAPLQVEKKAGKESPPLPYNLPGLQMDAIRILGMSAKNVLETAQALYEKKAITYPRTDCAHLASSQKPEVGETLDVVARLFPEETNTLRTFGIELRDSTFDDSKLADHHGIVPSRQFVPLEGLELQVFTLIAIRYLQTLSKDNLFDSTKVQMNANGVLFTANGKAVTFEGWRAIKAPK